jgi:asparagine synthase (glutamine-hydrolysing)
MCGILGIATPTLGDEEALVRDSLESLDHRGPDAKAVRAFPGGRISVVLGHTRLRIIDLSPEADQPLANEDGTVWVTYNGEIYNEPELRRGLEARGHTFRSRSDTEVLVHLYEECADEPLRMLDRLRGMFAFAIVDVRRERLFLARDRLGIKPLYWSQQAGRLAFASETRALVRAGFGTDDLGPDVLGDLLLWGHTRMDGSSAGIRELPPGSALTWNGGTPEIDRWWVPTPEPDVEIGQDAELLLRAVLQDSVRRHLVADRPVGIFLSGGIDSASVMAAAAATEHVRTFTIAFPGAEGDEGPAAGTLARHFGMRNDQVPITGGDVAEALPSILSAMDRPTADGVNSWLVSRAAHECGLVVALSGLGGDELFGGYPSFSLVPRLAGVSQGLAALPGGMKDRAIAEMGRRSPGGRVGRVLASTGGFNGAYASVRCLFSPAELRAAGVRVPLNERVGGDVDGLADGDRVTLLELANYMSEQLLRDTDQMSMAHSLEVRVPLLDDNLFRVAMAVPANVRLRAGKRLLARASGVPPAPKRPFALPFDPWMRGPLRDFVRGGLLSSDLPFGSDIPASFRGDLWDSFQNGRTHWSRPWTIAMLRRWADQRSVAVA